MKDLTSYMNEIECMISKDPRGVIVVKSLESLKAKEKGYIAEDVKTLSNGSFAYPASLFFENLRDRQIMEAKSSISSYQEILNEFFKRTSELDSTVKSLQHLKGSIDKIVESSSERSEKEKSLEKVIEVMRCCLVNLDGKKMPANIKEWILNTGVERLAEEVSSKQTSKEAFAVLSTLVSGHLKKK